MKWHRRSATGPSGTEYRIIGERVRDGLQSTREWWLVIRRPGRHGHEDKAIESAEEGKQLAEELEKAEGKSMPTEGREKPRTDGRKVIIYKAEVIAHLEHLEKYRNLVEIRMHADSGDGHLVSLPLREPLSGGTPHGIPCTAAWRTLRSQVTKALTEYAAALKAEIGEE